MLTTAEVGLGVRLEAFADRAGSSLTGPDGLLSHDI